MSDFSSDDDDADMIRPTLIRELQTILEQYRDNGQILKELVQNAEDAGASEVKFLYDEHSYMLNSDKEIGKYLEHPELNKFLGPAFYAYNNAQFSKKDWRGVRMLMDSVKEEDPMKVGKFGLGLKSVLHMTDLPSVLSGHKILIQDPHEKYFTKRTKRATQERTSGKIWHLQKHKKEIIKHQPQFLPFKGVFGCSGATFKEGHYDSTLFRFPLRIEESTLSKTIYTPQRVDHLFSAFEAEAHVVLLFLRSLEKIELYRRKPSDVDPTLLFTVKIEESCLQKIREKRVEFAEKLKTFKNKERVWMTQPACVSYITQVDTENHSNGEKKSDVWLVTMYCAGGDDLPELKAAFDTQKHFSIPLVGAAMLVSNSEYTLPGQVFCFLPLPHKPNPTGLLPQNDLSPTGLPIHVNGYFAVSHNRSDLIWPTSDDIRHASDGSHGSEDESIKWNEALIKEALPHAYRELVLKAIHHKVMQGDPTRVYGIIPNPNTVDEKWKLFLEPFFESLFQHEVFYCDLSNQWLGLEDNLVFDDMHDEPELQTLILRVLRDGQRNLKFNFISLPAFIIRSMEVFCPKSYENLAFISPSIVRGTLKTMHNSYSKYSREDRLQLLQYCLRDKQVEDLEKLQLLPLADGTFKAFSNKMNIAKTFISSPKHHMKLLPGLESHFLDGTVDKDIQLLLRKGFSNQLQDFDPESFASLIPKAIPPEWCEKDIVTFLGHGFQSHEDWLTEVWKYLQENFKNDLDPFEGLPLIPVRLFGCSDWSVLRIPQQRNPKLALLTCNTEGISLSKSLGTALSKVKVTVLEEVSLQAKNHNNILTRYINPPTARGILESLAIVSTMPDVGNEKLATLFNELTWKEVSEIRNTIYECSTECLQNVKKLLTALPMFTTQPKTGPTQLPQRVALFDAEENMTETLPFAVSKPLLDLSDFKCMKIAKQLDAKITPLTTVLKAIVFKDVANNSFYSRDTRNDVMKFVLKNLDVFIREDSQFCKTLRELKFLFVDGGKKAYKPTELFDPSCQELQRLFWGQNVFPVAFHNDDEESLIPKLKQVGLQGLEDVTITHLEEAAKFIANNQRRADIHPDLKRKSKTIMKVLNKMLKICTQAHNQGDHCRKLKKIAWVPYVQQRPSIYPLNLHWYGSGTKFNEPAAMKLLCHAEVVGSSIPLVDCEFEKVTRLFGWDVYPDVCHIINHLSNVVSSYQEEEKMRFSPIIHKIYEALNAEHVNTKDVLAQIEPRLERWIWNGGGFSRSKDVVLCKMTLDVRPYKFAIPDEVLKFRGLFTACGVEECVDQDSVLVEVMNVLGKKYQSSDERNRDRTAIDRDLALSKNILDKLSRAGVETDIKENVGDLPIPIATTDDTLKFFPLRQCTYVDKDWLRQSDQSYATSTDDTFQFIHPNISMQTAEDLGIPPLISRVLVKEDFEMEDYEQEHDLTTYLHDLLESYTDGFAIPKELVQNADDCGATEVKLLLDCRTNDDHMTTLIDENMKKCQGPALWAYNNGIFKDTDFDNLKKLAGRTKQKDSSTVGKFGLGFNAVYNVTDVPSIVSQKYIVFLDPHGTFLQGSKRKTKGLKLEISKNQRLLSKVPDQFYPYRGIFGCELENYYPGTLFRFPLRLQRSKISKTIYNEPQVKELIKLLIEGGENLLLFTQNVTKLSVFHIQEGDRPEDIKEIFTVSKQLLKYGDKTPNALKQQGILNAAKDFMEGELDISKAPSFSSMTNIQCHLSEYGQEWIGWPCGSQSVQSPNSGSKAYLIANCVGTQDSLKIAQKKESDDTLAPVAGVAVKITKNENGFIPVQVQNAKAFTFLPLPISTGLPFHINGTFAVELNRRELVKGCAESKRQSKPNLDAAWNNALAEDALVLSYFEMIRNLKTITMPQKTYYEIWPDVNKVNKELDCVDKFARKVYTTLASSNEPLLWSGEQWVTFASAVFMDPEFRKSSIGETAADTLRSQLKQVESKYLVDVPTYALECFTNNTNIQNQLYTQDRFFSEIFFPNISSIETSARNELVVFALHYGGDELMDLMKVTPCIPNTQGDLCKPDQLVHPYKRASKLYSEDDGRFPATEYKEHLPKLKILGMVTQYVTWNALVERAESVVRLGINDKQTSHRVTHILEHIEKKIEQTCEQSEKTIEEQAQEKLQRTAFLPAVVKPENKYPSSLTWHTIDAQLMPPIKLHTFECRHLVGCVAPITNIEFKSGVQRFLSVKTIPDENTVVEQFKEVLQSWTAAKASDLENTICNIYRYFSDCEMCPTVIRHLQDLRDEPFIIVGDALLPSTKVVFEVKPCLPYLYKLPQKLRPHKAFFEQMGVRHSFEAKDFVEALAMIHDAQIQSEEIKPLSKENLGVVRKIVQQLNETCEEGKLTFEDLGTIYLPDTEGILKPSVDIYYPSSYIPRKKFSFLHSDFSKRISSCLGLKEVESGVLSKYAKGISFGQQASLVTDIQRILRNYPGKCDIFKEMIQNADDSGATEIHFLLDTTHHGTKHIPGQQWAPLQGPALLVFNNQVFTEEDLQAITQLGRSPKRFKPGLTGEYGIGFNIVYNITDVPMFITSNGDKRGTFCAFDPLCRYVPNAELSEPGMRVDELGELFDDFPDLKPAFLQTCNTFTFENVRGTLFRLPLRIRNTRHGENQIQDMNISDQSPSIHDMRQLLKKFHEQMSSCLLFTKHISKISISEIARENSTVTCAVSREIQESTDFPGETLHNEFVNVIENVLPNVKEASYDSTAILRKEFHYTLYLRHTDNSTTLKEEEWKIIQSIGFTEADSIPRETCDEWKKNMLLLLPVGGVAKLIESRNFVTEQKPYIAYDKKPAKGSSGNVFCLLPLPVSSSLPVHINGHFALGFETRQSLDDQCLFRQQWNEKLQELVIAPCYASLLNEIRGTCLKADLSSNSCTVQAHSISSVIENYFKLFPKIPDTPKEGEPYMWESLAKGTYQDFIRRQLAILPVARKSTTEHDKLRNWQITWFPLPSENTLECQNVYFNNLKEIDPKENTNIPNNPRVGYEEKKRKDSEILSEVLLQLGLNLIEMSSKVKHIFQKCGFEIQNLSPDKVVSFMKTCSHPMPHCCLALPAQLKDTPFRNIYSLKLLLRYCKDQYNHLEGLPFLLTKDGRLQIFSRKSTCYRSEFHDLVDTCSRSHLFLHPEIQKYFKSHEDPKSGLKDMKIADLAGIICSVLSPQFQPGSTSSVKWEPKNTIRVPNRYWLSRIWDFISNECSQCTSKDQIRKMISPLQTWALVPVTVKSESRLVPISDATYVIDFKPTKNEQRLYDVPYSRHSIETLFKQLGVPSLTNEDVDCSVKTYTSSFHSVKEQATGAHYMKCLVTNLQQPTDVLKALHRVLMSVSSSKTSVLDTTQILKFFNYHVSSMERISSIVMMLKDLPFYQLVNGQRRKLSSFVGVYVLPEDIPCDDMDVWQQQTSLAFLKYNEALSGLFKFIGCEELQVTFVYQQYIFQHIEYLSNKAKDAHLFYVYSKYLQKTSISRKTGGYRDQQQLKESLKELEFLPDAGDDSDSVYWPACKYYDPDHPVFQEMFRDDLSKFPSCLCINFETSKFRRDTWLDFLREVGLVQHVTIDDFILFASQVASEAKCNRTEATERKSRALVKCLFNNKDIWSAEEYERLLNNIKHIEFITPNRVHFSLLQLRPQHNEQNGQVPYIAFKGSLLGRSQNGTENEKLAWTTTNLLPKWADPAHCISDVNKRSRVMKNLEISDKPNVYDVIHHCRILSSHFYRHHVTDSRKQTLMTGVFCLIYTFLQENALDGTSAKDVLSKIPCVLIDRSCRLVGPFHISFNMLENDAIPPYLYKIPDFLGTYKDLFLYLGASDNPSVHQYAKALSLLHADTRGQKITDPNTLLKVSKAVRGFFTKLAEENKQNPRQQELFKEMLYLPSQHGQLIKSSDLVLNNAPAFTDRICAGTLKEEFLMNLGQCGITTSHGSYEEIIELLPEDLSRNRLRPRMLTNIVKEKMVNEDASKHGENFGVEHTIQSQEFFRAVIRIAKHESFMTGECLKENIENSIVSSLQKVEIFRLENLETYLEYNGQEIHGSRREQACFVEELEESKKCCIYLKMTDKFTEETLVKLTQVVNKITGGILGSSVIFLVPLFTCGAEELDSKLDKMNVRGNAEGPAQIKMLPSPGEVVTMDTKSLLPLSPSIECNDFVAYSPDGNSCKYLQYAIVKSKPTNDECQIDDGSAMPIVVQKIHLFSFPMCADPED